MSKLQEITEEELQKLCNDHWERVEYIIRNEYDSESSHPNGTALDLDAYCRRLKLHYITAMAHGFKHGVQWIETQIEKEYFK